MYLLNQDQKKEIFDHLSKVFATNFSLYLKTHSFHWHIKGSHFLSYHLLLEEHYKKLFETIDELAELIRPLGFKVPASYRDIQHLSSVSETSASDSPEDMFKELIEDNKTIFELYTKLHQCAESHNEYVTQNLIEEKLSYHSQAIWFYEETLGRK